MCYLDDCTEEEKLAFHKVLSCISLDAFRNHKTDNFDDETVQTFLMDDGTEKDFKFKFRVQILSVNEVS